MSSDGRFYEPSGVVTFRGLLLIVIGGALGAVVLGALYGYAILYIPWIYFAVLLPCLFGAGVGAAVGYGARFGHTRSPGFSGFFGLIFGILAWYCGWVSWIFALSKQQTLVFSPAQILEVMKSIVPQGTWGLSQVNVTGWVLIVLWILEALATIGIAMLLAMGMNSDPYCEQCRKWIDKHGQVYQLQPTTDPEKLKREILSDVSFLRNLKMKSKTFLSGTKNYLEAEITQCPFCRVFTLLTLRKVEVLERGKGKENKFSEPVIQNLIIPPEYAQIIQSLPPE